MELWQQFILQAEKELGSSVVNQWLRTLKVVRFDAGNLYLESNDSFQISWFEEHIRPRLKLTNNNNRPIKVHLQQSTPSSAPSSKPSYFQLSPDPIDPTLTLETFSISSANNMAFNLISDFFSPFNPIFLFGPSNCGKTHLLNAAALAYQKRGKKVFFVRAEKFTEHVVQAIRLGMMQEFRKVYREIDVLIVDDIHIFSRKTATQEEFFHTFNTLHTQGKQIILSANTAPSLLQEIEPRLMSRFEWGISAGMEKVDSRAILEKKAKLWNIELTEDLTEYLTSKFSDPVQALQALSIRARGPINKLTAVALLRDLAAKETHNSLTPEMIIREVAAHFGVTSEDLTGKSQLRECVAPRQIAMYLCREKLKLPYQHIGRIFGRDHSTVMSSVKLVGNRGDLHDRLKELKF